VDLLVL